MESSPPSLPIPYPSIIQRPSLSALASRGFFSPRDLPPQSHKSTEDRCLLCLIKALPPGVIPQFEQEEKPSEGGGGVFWINPMKSPYYTLSFRSHQRDTASQRFKPAPLLFPLSHLRLLSFSVCVYLYFTPLSLFIILFSFSSLWCDCQRVSWHAGWLARGGFFQRRLFTRRRLRMIDSWLVKACSCSGCRMTGA